MRFRRIEKLDHERVPLERLLHDAALNPFPAAVNQPHFAQTGVMRGANIFVDDRCDVLGQKGVKVERVFDRNVQRIAIGRPQGFS